jgi:uncharacterized protein YecE (DUF72 family)
MWYRLPSEQTVQSWIDQTPAHFLFAPKAHRQITHIHRLKPDALSYVRLMLDRLTALKESGRLGPVLLQLPPNLRRDDDRLARFLEQLPQNIRWAIEFRNVSWHVGQVEALLRNHGVAWAAVETDEAAAERHDTAGFWYIRLRRSRYGETALEEWAAWLKTVTESGKDGFLYLKHEDEGSPWVWADRLIQLTGG